MSHVLSPEPAFSSLPRSLECVEQMYIIGYASYKMIVKQSQSHVLWQHDTSLVDPTFSLCAGQNYPLAQRQIRDCNQITLTQDFILYIRTQRHINGRAPVTVRKHTVSPGEKNHVDYTVDHSWESDGPMTPINQVRRLLNQGLIRLINQCPIKDLIHYCPWAFEMAKVQERK